MCFPPGIFLAVKDFIVVIFRGQRICSSDVFKERKQSLMKMPGSPLGSWQIECAVNVDTSNRLRHKSIIRMGTVHL